MQMIDIIEKKKNGLPLTSEEIHFWIDGLVNETIPLYQSSALLMAILLKGMENHEIYHLTSAMYHSGDILKPFMVSGIKADKHSTGGVGDKTSLVLGPLVASCGLKVMKMSGRGLGHTGGTLDKLESIPGFKIDVSEEHFLKQVNDIGLAIVGQNKNLCPADKKLYALRDVTGTVNSIPLIASSIMSKKLATSCDTILLDVTVGSGAFMKDFDSALELANLMIRIGEFHHLNTKAMITNMDEPLGRAVGNILEVKEAVETLKGNGPEDLVELCLEAGAIMLMQANMYSSKEETKEVLKKNLYNGKAFDKFIEMVKEQGGDTSYVLDLAKFDEAPIKYDIFAKEDGYIEKMNALELGKAGMRLGAGREVLTDPIDYKAGLYLHHKVGDQVAKGEKLLTLYTSKTNFDEEIKEIENAIVITNKFVKKPQLIYKVL